MYDIIKTIYLILMSMMHLEITGREKLKEVKNCLICSNHISANDPPMIGSLIKGKINYLAKSELFRNKLFGKILFSVHAIPVHRGRMDRRAIRLVEERLAAGESVVVFPEGTRKAARIKPGAGKFALEMQKDILPIYIENSDDIWGCISGRKKLKCIVGDYIKIDQFKDMEATKENFQYISEYIMTKINELKNRD